MATSDAERQRAELLASWEQVAPRWGRQAERLRDMGMPVSMWMIDHLQLQAGQRVLELAAGPGDTGFLAAELVAPGGTLICSDGAESMLEVARERAAALGITNIEFQALQLEWIDLPTASVEAVLCRWALMLAVDPATALREVRRVLRPGGRAAIAVWDGPAHNPWATIARQAFADAGHPPPEDPAAPGMFALASADRVGDMLEEAGFTEVLVEAVAIWRQYADVGAYLNETLELSHVVGQMWADLAGHEREAAGRRMAELAAPFESGGRLWLPGRSLVAAATA